MLKAIKDTSIFNSIKQDIVAPSHAYLFYGEDERFNIELARVFIASIFCGKPACFVCEACRRMEINKNPDLLILDKPNLQVADIDGLIDNVQLKPMLYNYKIVFITNAEGINETAQNKLLKTLEEPNPQVIFVLTCTNLEKLLPTIKSRLKKQYVPMIDIEILSQDMKNQGIDIDRFIHCDTTLTDAVKYANKAQNDILNIVENSIILLKTSADIPKVTSSLKIKTEQRKEYLNLLSKAVDCALTGVRGIFNDSFIQHLKATFNIKMLIKMLKLIDEATRKLNSNVNFNYVIDELFYNILKEKYLCK